ncbi:MAG: DUF6491 family protein [Aquincola sp.]|nr:DUF6491 family protein [Aquincola sp.]MDH4288131.1 DUF6491 family protein [Aquincola sp.]MDH5328829.1 DUF6491 family protein [Aquincola sp.]
MNRFRNPSALLAVVIVAAACASTPDEHWTEQLTARGLAPAETVNSIPDFRLDGFNVLDSEHLIVYTGVQRRHLVTFGAPCPGLRFAQRLAYDGTAGSLGRLDTLTVIGQGPAVPCVIESIRVLTPVATKKAA